MPIKRSSPLDDLTYDVIALLHEKAKGLEAFERYIEDAEGDEELVEIFERAQAHDSECIEELQGCLARLMGAGEIEADEEDEEEESESSQHGKSRKRA